ncbi:MAG: GNAT family N-acetyltransferase [Wenzhouxiangella sp.]
MSSARIEVVRGQAVLPWLDELAALRIRVFREFPYLYDGSLDYEREYLAEYAQSARGLIVLALAEDGVVGCSTGLPLSEAAAEFRQPWLDDGRDPSTVFYFGESVLERRFRGQGLGHRFFDAREAHAARLGFEITAFCAVIRSADHPSRPANYRALDGFWTRRGYLKQPALIARFAWKDIDEKTESPKALVFWQRAGLLGALDA